MSDQPEYGERGFSAPEGRPEEPSSNGVGGNGFKANGGNASDRLPQFEGSDREPSAPSPFAPLTPPKSEPSPFMPLEAGAGSDTVVPPSPPSTEVVLPPAPREPVEEQTPVSFQPTPSPDAPGSIVLLSLANILRPISADILGFSPEAIPASAPVRLPLQVVKQQLPFGKIEVPISLLAEGCDDPYRSALLATNQSTLIPVPMQDVFHALPEGEVSSSAASAQVAPPEQHEGPFSQLSEEVASAAPAPAPAPPAGGQPLSSGFPAPPTDIESPFVPVDTIPSEQAPLGFSTGVESPIQPTPKAEDAAPEVTFEEAAQSLEQASDDGDSAASYGSLSGFLDFEEETESPAEAGEEVEGEAASALDEIMFRESAAPSDGAIHEDMEGLSGGELLSILESFAGGGQITGLSTEGGDEEEAEDDSDDMEVAPETAAESDEVKLGGSGGSFRDLVTMSSTETPSETPSETPAKATAEPDPELKEEVKEQPVKESPRRPIVEAPLRSRMEESSQGMGALSPGFQCSEIPGQIELKAAFGVSRNLTARDVVELCSELAGVEACVAVLPSGVLRPSLQRSGDSIGQFYDKAPGLLEHVFSLAEDIGIADAQILNIRNRSDVRTFIQQGDAGMAVLHTDDVLAPGVREKLILATRELAKEMRI